ncbi:hypothetical protein DFA_06432 [Cavenderia fasciculata]|uniref:Uncharacterized protein n=1 Tax=Cavenderia fasciculata TaxID=261658 RepID=F4PIZ6_CACFS|nr:uncharacterized protein DFA_06432 [Cavenderia fasciculata]EGG24282.1 hypothetical protein DFA_06432 [Cavenderia fasciculata]|eukprot:XP_004362133.1 hypothetical protein DFA_06432 [Cavenderia fasciculata]
MTTISDSTKELLVKLGLSDQNDSDYQAIVNERLDLLNTKSASLAQLKLLGISGGRCLSIIQHSQHQPIQQVSKYANLGKLDSILMDPKTIYLIDSVNFESQAKFKASGLMVSSPNPDKYKEYLKSDLTNKKYWIA